MTRQVLPAKRRYCTLGNILLCSWLAGCAAGYVAKHIPPPSPGVPLSVWSLEFGKCWSVWARPALLCRPGEPMPAYDGCDWTCREP